MSDERPATLSYAVGGERRETKISQPRVVLGRSPSCDIVVAEERVSRQHATVMREGDGWSLFDMGSANGTFVNDKPVVKCALHDGDVITLGEIAITFNEQGPSHRVIIESDKARRNKTAVFNMADLSVISSVSEARRSDSTQAAAWAIGLFSQAAQALLSSENLDDVFEKVLSLVFKNLPVERAVLALYTDGEIVPRITRSRSGRDGETIRISQSIALEAVRSKQAIIVGDALSDERFGGEESILAMRIRSAMCAPLYNEGVVSGILYVDSKDARRSSFTEEQLRLLSTFAVFSAVAIEQTKLHDKIQREERIRSRLEMYNSKAVVDRIVEGAISGKTGGEMIAEEREVSVIFADLSGFTSLSETMSPQEVALLLNGVFDQLTHAIFTCDGTLDKFMGDGMMAFFGAPLSQPDHAERAVRAALLMQEKLDYFNEQEFARRGERIRMRIGINSGSVVAGDIGSPKRKDYTVIGDAVNVASRLESSVARPGQIVIGPNTYEQVQHLFDCRALQEVKLKGKELSVLPYVVLGAKG